MQKTKTIIFFTFFYLTAQIFGARSAFAADAAICSPADPSSVTNVIASASAFSNLRSAKGSLKYELNKMLSERLDLVKQQTVADSTPQIILSTIPNKYQDDYGDEKECAAMLKQTSETPFSYSGKNFDSKNDLVSWFYDFTQGNGDDGEDLYKRCPGSCSPQYTSVVKPNADKLILDVYVVCGHARDKWDNQYRLSSYLTNSCK